MGRPDRLRDRRDVGLPAEFGNPGEHYSLVDPEPKALSEGLGAFLNSERLRAQMGRSAREWVEARLDVSGSLDRFAALYQSVRIGRSVIGRREALLETAYD